MKPIRTFTIIPSLPASLEELRALAYNLRWAWNHDTKEWPQIQVEVVDTGSPAELPVGGEVRVQARVHLGALTPDEVRVEVYAGRVDADDELTDIEAMPMQLAGPDGDGAFRFEAGHLPCRTSGLHGYTVRVLPHHPDLTTPFQPGLIRWIN